MPKYRVTISARATIGEEWLVEAESVEAAEQVVLDNRLAEGATFVRDWVAGDEEDRQVGDIELEA